MSYAEARRGPLSLFNDIVYTQLSGSGGFSRTVSGRVATATFGADVKVDYQLAIVASDLHDRDGDSCRYLCAR
jgi:hypothetical protein